MKTSRVKKFLPKDWWDKLTPEEIEQEELIKAWEHPELDGYQGLFAFGKLLYDVYNENKHRQKAGLPQASADLDAYEEQQLSADPETELEVLLQPGNSILKLLTPFERYCLHLISEKGVTGTAEYLDEPRSSIERMLTTIKAKVKTVEE